MKRLSLTILSLLLMGVLFTGCKKEEEKTNYLQIDDQVIKITHGDLEYGGTAPNGYYVAINLLTSGITLDADGYWEGEGTGIWIQFISTANDGVSTGTYVFNASYPAFSFSDVEYCLDWTEDYGTNSWVDITSGTAEITRSGSSYVINLTGMDAAGNDVRANFSGSFDLYDFSSKGAGSHR